jgi:Pyrimidine dimer DNA glycosylase
MRLWTLHPKHLDAKGLVTLWREALLAQKVLQGKTRGYRHHPQLLRFLAARNPAGALASYLAVVYEESVRRGYHFDRRKIGVQRFRGRITETKGQLLYEWGHLKRKLSARDPARHRACRSVRVPEAHPLFRLIAGKVRTWEKQP